MAFRTIPHLSSLQGRYETFEASLAMKIVLLIISAGTFVTGFQTRLVAFHLSSPEKRSAVHSAPTKSDSSVTSSEGIDESLNPSVNGVPLSPENDENEKVWPVQNSTVLLSEVDFQAYANGYKTVFSELPFAECKASFGTIPTDLKGSYFRSGPAMFSAGSIPPPKTSIIQPRDGPPVPDGQNPKRMVQHPFEGDGGMLGVTFPGDGSATARFRYVRTTAFTNERRKGQRLYRGMDSTRELGNAIGLGLGNDIHNPLFRHHLQPGLNKNRKNTSNTRAIYWGKRLLSLWEGGQPYKMDGLALSTEGRSLLGGVLGEQDPFGSKMVIDPVKQHALMYAVTQDSKTSRVTVFEFNDKFRLVDEGEAGNEGKVTLDLPGLALISDMAVTLNYAVFVRPAVSTGMQFLFMKEPGKIVNVEQAPSVVHLIPRVGSSKQALSIEIPFDGVVEANLEFCNAYEDGDKLVFDAIRSDGSHKSTSDKITQWPWVTSQKDYADKSSDRSLWRYEVDLDSKVMTKEKLTDIQCYFGSVAPNRSTLKHHHIVMAVGGLGKEISPPQGIARYDCLSKTMETWMPASHEFCGEPVLAPRSDESSSDDGYILSVLYDGHAEKSDLVIFDSANIAAGPLCRIPLGIGIPHGLYGFFTTAEEATWSFEEIQRRAKLADKMESRGNLWNEVKSDFSGLGLRLDDMEEYFGDSFLS
jgi:all-trans-8'-apo-beta-carotenal 15,15'-oxygenase